MRSEWAGRATFSRAGALLCVPVAIVVVARRFRHLEAIGAGVDEKFETTHRAAVQHVRARTCFVGAMLDFCAAGRTAPGHGRILMSPSGGSSTPRRDAQDIAARCGGRRLVRRRTPMWRRLRQAGIRVNSFLK